MACYSPLKAFDTGELTRDGKPKYKICDFRTDHLEQFTDGSWTPCYDPYISGRRKVRTRYITVPCGSCIGCRLEHAKQWSLRCMLEAREHKSNYFLTLTIDDGHLVKSEGVNPYTGEIQEGYTLVKKDLQDFWKRLRKSIEPKKIRYFACGEYGSKTFRPHYHAIVFGLDVPDLRLYKTSPLGDNYYVSEWLQSLWPLGFVIVGEVTQESCSYVARYVTKKINEGLDELYEAHGMAPEFLVMSRKPGIARQYLDDHPDLFEYSSIVVGTQDGQIKGNIPRYFKRIRYDQDPDCIDRDHDRYHSKMREDLKVEVIENETGLKYADYLEQLEGVKLRQITALKRDSI